MQATVVLVLIAVWGCGKSTDGDSNPVAADTAPAVEADTDADSGPPAPCSSEYDTAICPLFYAGDAHTRDGGFVSGDFGFVVATPELVAACTDLSEWSETADAAPDCPQCDWAFNLTLANGSAVGVACASVGLVGGEWDGFTGSFGFAESLDLDYNGTMYTLDLAVMYYAPGYGWGPLAYNYDGHGYNTGNGESLTFMRLYGYALYP